MNNLNVGLLTEEQKFALFYGVMLGDGCLSFYKTKKQKECFTIAITGSSRDDYPFFKVILVPLLKSFGRKSITIKERRDCEAIEFNFQDKELFNRVKSYGFPVGKKGINITILSYFYKNNLVKEVVAGFMATDGSLVLTKNPHKFYPRIEACGISKNLIIQIYNFLSSCGMKGAYYLAKRTNREGTYGITPQYRLQFNGMKNLLLFNEKIGFVNPKYHEKFKNFLEYSKKYDLAIKGIPTQQHKNVRINSLSG